MTTTRSLASTTTCRAWRSSGARSFHIGEGAIGRSHRHVATGARGAESHAAMIDGAAYCVAECRCPPAIPNSPLWRAQGGRRKAGAAGRTSQMAALTAAPTR
jgi:hypothetical protein